MTQYVINIGAIPNDGTGDPLRTAFNETNLNFDQVFAAGPVLSNIQIANNTILTTNVNGNLVLAPNGIGRIQANATIVPSVANVRDLGSATQRWNTVYAQYLDLSGVLTTGDLIVDGNLTVQGNTIQIGNIVTDTKTIQLANTASNASSANGSGITVGLNDNIATMLYSSASNVWTTNIGISATGNISGNFVAPGANGQVLYNRSGVIGASPSNFNFDQSTQTLYVTVGAFAGQANGTNSLFVGAPGFTELGSNIMGQFTGNVASYSQINLQNTSNASAASGDYVITADNGTDSTYYLDMGLLSSNHADSDFFGDTGTANDGYLYVTANDQAGPGNTNIGNLIVGSTNGVIKLFVGNTAQANVIQTVSTNGVTVAGNILPSANVTYSLGNSSLWWSNIWVANNTIYIGGVALGMTAGNVLTVGGNAVLSNDSNTSITTTGTITADSLTANSVNIGNSNLLYNYDDDYLVFETLANAGYRPSNDDLYKLGNTSYRWSEVHANVYYGDGSQLTGLSTNSISNGNSSVDIPVVDGNVTVSTNGTHGWTFDDTGNLLLPRGGIVYETNIPDGGLDGNTIALKPSGGTNADQQLLIYPTTTDANHLHLTSGNLYNTELFLGDDNLYVKLANTGNIVINSNDNAGNTAQWTFGTNESLTLPGGSRLRPLGANLDIFAGTGSYVNLITSDESSSMGVSGAGGYVTTAGGTWNFNTNGNLTAPGNVSAVGNVTSGNLTVGSGTITGGNVNGAVFNGNVAFGTGTVGGSGNITGGNLITTGSGGDITMTGGNITGVGNISAGNVSATGNVTAANFFGNGNTLSNVATQVKGSWTVTTGTNNYSFTVPINNTYQLWVNGNIPNGIIVYNATVSVSNTNVPVIGQQFAWNYEGAGNPITFTSIPAQIIGTANAISNANPSVGTTTNVFTFGINNSSGNTVTVNYGYTKIS